MPYETRIDMARFRRNMARLEPQLKRGAKDVITTYAAKYESHLGRNVPKKDGDLEASIENRNTSSGDRIEQTVSIGNDSDARHAVPLEFGHNSNGTFVEPKPYARPLMKRYNRLYKAALRRMMKKLVKSFR